MNNVFSHFMTIPVLVMFGDHDANLIQPVSAIQDKLGFSSSRDFTLRSIPDAGTASSPGRTLPAGNGRALDQMAGSEKSSFDEKNRPCRGSPK